MDGAIDGMMGALGDPFSSYMAPDTAQQFSEQIEGSFTGIGAEVSMENGNVVVVSPIKGSPAEKAGIQPKDILLSVNGESFEGLSLNEAVAKIRGPKGTEAKIKVKRAGSDTTLEFTIVRDDIALETVYSRMEDGGVGVIEVTEFSMNTAERFKEELASLEKKGMKGLVIDVRNNPGGVLTVVEDMSEQFVPKGKVIVQVEDKNKRRQQTLSDGSGKKYPIVVVTNKGSASASEILAGALQESAGAKLVGEATYGKGTVQSSYTQEMGDGSMLKITIAKWLTPNGEWIHKKGIQPDIAVSQPDYFSVAPINKEKNVQIRYAGRRHQERANDAGRLGAGPRTQGRILRQADGERLEGIPNGPKDGADRRAGRQNGGSAGEQRHQANPRSEKRPAVKAGGRGNPEGNRFVSVESIRRLKLGLLFSLFAC
ncbi:hypothetical protein HMSSN036_24530 [Paenibacillus macerans]|nr:hypothetical protein HMSSN036_24530 [Paenibacillus macerans]